MRQYSTLPILRAMRLDSPHAPLLLIAGLLAAVAILAIAVGPLYAWTAYRAALLTGLHALAALL
jgi:hypothetical protein